MVNKVINYLKNEYKFIIMLAIIIFTGLFRLPYNIYTGGGILNIADKLEIENEYHEKGSFNMAYVKSIKATIPIYLLSYVFDLAFYSLMELNCYNSYRIFQMLI